MDKKKEKSADVKSLWGSLALILGLVVFATVVAVFAWFYSENMISEPAEKDGWDVDWVQDTSDTYYTDKAYVEMFNEDRANKNGDIYVYIENVDNADEAIMIRVVGQDFYVANRGTRSLVGSNERVAMTESSEFVDDLAGDLQSIGMLSKDNYKYYYDFDESVGRLNTAQKRLLWRYCQALDYYARGLMKRDTYERVTSGIVEQARRQ